MDSLVNSIKITVLMPVFNCELFIQEAIESILNQTYVDFEFLIIDDASTDQTVSLIKAYSDSRIYLIEKPVNTGYTNSLNYGLQLAKGKYIARMDGDDVSLPERFAKQVSYLEANPEVVLCGTYYKILGNDKHISIPESFESIKLALLRGNCIAHPSVMIRKKVLDDFSIVYDTTREPAEDYAMWVRLLSFGELYNLPEILLQYRLHKTQVSRKRAEEQRNSVIKTKFELLHFLDVVLDFSDHEILNKIFKENSRLDFGEIKIFKQVQKKLINSNNAYFFDSCGFQLYLKEMEAIVLRKCFLGQPRYSPLMYLKYIIAKCKFGVQLNSKQEFKLFVKSMAFFKVTRA